MNAKFKTNEHNGNIAKNRKEKNFTSSILAVVEDKRGGFEPFRVAVEARFYRTDTRCYCCLWVSGTEKGVCVSGGACAGGYGYCKESTAFEKACDDAGIELSEPVAGRGRYLVRDAMRAICKAATGRRKISIITTNG